MRLSTAGLLSLCVPPVACRVLPALLAQYGGTNTTLVEVDGTLPSVSDSPVSELPLPQLLFTDPDPPLVSSPDLHVRNIPTSTPDNLNTVKKQGHNNGLRSQNTHPTNETIAPGTENVVAYAALAKRDFKHNEAVWQKAVCTGEKLTQASLRNKDTAVNYVRPIDSDFDGIMEKDLSTWGYTDLSWQGADNCDLTTVVPELTSLGINVDWSDYDASGQNTCFNVAHYYKDPWQDLPVVKSYWVDNKIYFGTGAYCQIAVNARDGLVSFVSRRSALKAAIDNWGVEHPEPTTLPKLRKMSDIAWGFWNRAHTNHGVLDHEGLKNIKYILAHDVVNEETQALLHLAMQTYEVPPGQERHEDIPTWPGVDFYMWSEEGKATLASPNGLAAGYFLAQHKTQLGGNKYVYKVTVWVDDNMFTQLLFWIKYANE